jgi:Secretion system C-terminal sorting domain
MFIMKTISRLILMVSVMVLFLVLSISFAQPADTVIVPALTPDFPQGGAINNIINSDTTAQGFIKPNTVFLLKPTGPLDTVYYMTAPISAKGNIRVVGYINPITGHPPVVAPSIAADNTSIGNFFSPQGNDTLELRGIYFLGTRTDGISFTGRFAIPSGDSTVYIFDHCVLENISGAGTPNLFDTYDHDHSSFYVTNCEFRNNQDDNPQNPGFAWVDPGTYPCDTAIFKNNTFFLTGGYILGSSGYGCTYLDFEHNTVFISGQGGAFDLYQMHNAVIKDNIFFGVSSAAYPEAWYNNVPGSWGSAVIPLDSLRSLAYDPYNMTEADRHLTITNNAYFWPQQIVDKWTELNTAGITDITPLRPPDFINSQPGMLTDKTSWPYINVTNNDSVDPGFDAPLVQTAAGNMAAFVDTIWHNNQAANGFRPYVYALNNPPSLTSDWPNVASNWAATQGYPVPENLKYTNSALMAAASDGKPLGDLNWFKGIVGIHEIPNSTPTKFILNQNYPNPFNPTTTIRYSIPQSGFVILKVFNLLGQEVATLVNQEQKSGEYNVDFDASNLASGIYMYKIQSGNFNLTKKMILLK